MSTKEVITLIRGDVKTALSIDAATDTLAKLRPILQKKGLLSPGDVFLYKGESDILEDEEGDYTIEAACKTIGNPKPSTTVGDPKPSTTVGDPKPSTTVGDPKPSTTVGDPKPSKPDGSLKASESEKHLTVRIKPKPTVTMTPVVVKKGTSKTTYQVEDTKTLRDFRDTLERAKVMRPADKFQVGELPGKGELPGQVASVAKNDEPQFLIKNLKAPDNILTIATERWS